MYETKEMLLENNYGIDISAPKISTKGYYLGYDVRQNRVLLLSSLTSTKAVEAPTDYKMEHTYDVFVPVNQYTNNCIFSQYLNKYATDVNVTTDKGFGVGDCNTLKTLDYSNSSLKQEVLIRTNSATTDITINASLDSVSHYGNAGVIDIQKIATTSFWEYGSAAFIEFAVGRIVLTKTSDVEVINVEKKDENTYNNPIIADGGVEEENMPEIISRDQVTVTDSRGKTELVQIQILDNSNNIIEANSEQVYAYSNNTVGTTEKITTGIKPQNQDIDTLLGLIVLDSGSHGGEKAYSEAKKEEIKNDSINSKLDEQLLDQNDYVVRVDDVGYTSLATAFKNTTDGCVVRLLKNTNVFYSININNSLTFNLNNKTININSNPADENEVAAVGDWNPIVNNLFNVANGVNLVVTGNGTINTSTNSTDWQTSLILFNYENSETTCSLTIEDGTYNIHGSILTVRKNCTATINGGSFNETKTTTGTNMFRVHGGRLIVNDANVNLNGNAAAFYITSSSLHSYCIINDINIHLNATNNELLGYCPGLTYIYINGGTYYIGADNLFDDYSDEITELVVSGGFFDVDITQDDYTYDPDWRYSDFIQSGKTITYNSEKQMYEVN